MGTTNSQLWPLLPPSIWWRKSGHHEQSQNDQIQACINKEASPLFSGLVRRRSAASATPAAARHRPDSRPSSASSPSRPARANLSGRTHRRFRRRRCTPCRSRTGRSEIEASWNESRFTYNFRYHNIQWCFTEQWVQLRKNSLRNQKQNKNRTP